MPSFKDIRTDCPRCQEVADAIDHQKSWSSEKPVAMLIHQFVCPDCRMVFRVAEPLA